MNLRELKQLKIAELAAMARDMEIENASVLRKQELIFALLNEQTKKKRTYFWGRGFRNPTGRLRFSSCSRLQLPTRTRRHLRIAVTDSQIWTQDW